MHKFLPSIGFKSIKEKKEYDKILIDTLDHYDEKTVVMLENNVLYGQISKRYGKGMGMSVCGEYDEEDVFHVEYAFPYFNGSSIMKQDRILIERQAATESYAGAFDDYRIGITLIFYLQNGMRYRRYINKGNNPKNLVTVALSALSSEGKILFPVQKTKSQVLAEKEAWIHKKELIQSAKEGDEEAMESLTREDIDTCAMVSYRIQQREDVLSIVDSYFMPHGFECDQYAVLGEIMDYHHCQNLMTGEWVYQLSLNCNDMQFDVCINEEDLFGEPAIGRRFKGLVWLQGKLQV